MELIDEREANFAAEAGVWIRERSEVWYTTWINDGPTRVEILNLADRNIRSLSSSMPLENPNRGYDHQGLVYFTCLRNDSRGWPGGVVSVDPETGHVEWILNSYFGLKFDSIDDVTWVTQPGTNHSFMFITILPNPEGTEKGENDTLPQGLWRWDPQAKLLLPAISRTEFPVANGVRVSRDQKAPLLQLLLLLVRFNARCHSRSMQFNTSRIDKDWGSVWASDAASRPRI